MSPFVQVTKCYKRKTQQSKAFNKACSLASVIEYPNSIFPNISNPPLQVTRTPPTGELPYANLPVGGVRGPGSAIRFYPGKRRLLNKSLIRCATTQVQSNLPIASIATAVKNGEILKQPLMDFLLTDSEQTTFSLSELVSSKGNPPLQATRTPPTGELPYANPPVGGVRGLGSDVTVQIGEYIKSGDKVGEKNGMPVVLGVTGKVIKLSKTQITLQNTQPVLFFTRGQVHVQDGQWVDRGTPILTLSHQTLITGDIVQGIPRIEQLFEAPTSKEGQLKFESLQSQVKEMFVNNLRKLPFPTAARKSIELIQQVLVESIQKVYLSQGVLIADKHIEIVVRQMTSKGRVVDSGNTGLFLNEVLPLSQIENANITTPGKKAFYVPTVIGLTRAALNSDSFISAASFQETTRVLSRDALTAKSDFLRGLKEKVVIGDLISAGTGLDVYTIYNRFVHEEAFKKHSAPRYILDIVQDKDTSENSLLSFQERKHRTRRRVPRNSSKVCFDQSKRLIRVN